MIVHQNDDDEQEKKQSFEMIIFSSEIPMNDFDFENNFCGINKIIIIIIYYYRLYAAQATSHVHLRMHFCNKCIERYICNHISIKFDIQCASYNASYNF